MTAAPALPDVLICAGLDPSGGAGLIADVRVVSELGARAVGVVTALTVQNTTGAIAVEPVAAALVREQLEFLLSDVEVKAVKIGMFGASDVAAARARGVLHGQRGHHAERPRAEQRCDADVRDEPRAARRIEPGADQHVGDSGRGSVAIRHQESNACRPVMSCPTTSVWMSCVPSYV